MGHGIGAEPIKKRKERKAPPSAAEAAAALMPGLLCRRGHTMGKRSTNPRGYSNKACCDVCGKADLPKRCDEFFHCSFCRFDLGPKCAAKPLPAELQLGKGKKRRHKEGN